MMPHIISLILCCVIHEGGHYLAALCFGRRLSFRFSWGRFYVPRWTWTMPRMESWKQRITAGAGFVTEIAVATSLYCIEWPYMLLWSLIHLCAYPIYSGDASDFKWLRR